MSRSTWTVLPSTTIGEWEVYNTRKKRTVACYLTRAEAEADVHERERHSPTPEQEREVIRSINFTRKEAAAEILALVKRGVAQGAGHTCHEWVAPERLECAVCGCIPFIRFFVLPAPTTTALPIVALEEQLAAVKREIDACDEPGQLEWKLLLGFRTLAL